MPLSNKTRRLLNKYEEAVRADEFKGADPPETWEQTTKEFKEAKKKFVEHIEQLEYEADDGVPF